MTNQDGTAAVRDPYHGEIETLFVNNPILQEIEAYLTRFNPIRVMKMAHMEIRHSAVLCWLMDPVESHGLGDHFLRAFLGEALRGHGDKYPSALEIAQADLRDAEVRNEWNNIDIFVQSPSNGWAFIIENKYYGVQHGQQLQKYKKRVRDLFASQYGFDRAKEITVRGIFLRLGEELPEDTEYTSLRYEQICGFLRRFLQNEAFLIPPNVATFLHHYLDVLETETGMSEEQEKMEQLARQLYRKHKKVLDFVMKHGAGSAFALAARNLFGEKPKELSDAYEIGGESLVFAGLSNSIVSFLPKSWFDAFSREGKEWAGCEDWWAGFPLIVWLQIWPDADGVKGKLYLYAEVGPLSSYELRKGLIEDIQQAGTRDKSLRLRFQKGAAEEGRSYSKFFSNNRAAINDVHDAEQITSAIRELVGRFQKEFSVVADVLWQEFPSRAVLNHGKSAALS